MATNGAHQILVATAARDRPTRLHHVRWWLGEGQNRHQRGGRAAQKVHRRRGH